MAICPPLHFVVPVWGASYVQTFLEYCLPAQLSPDNIPAIASEHCNRYIIYTTRADHQQLETAASFRALRRVISVTVEYLDGKLSVSEGTPNKYQIKSECYRDALQRAGTTGAAVFALNADVLLANGFVRSAVDLLSRGKRVIEVPGPRGLRDPMGAALSSFRSSDGISISIEPVELSKLWVRNLHPQLAMHYVDGPTGGPFHPSHLYWLVGEEGAIIRGFHLYPIVIDPHKSSIDFSTTIDDDLVANLQLSEGELFLAQDSRTMFCCELSPPEHHVGQMASRGDLSRYIEFYSSYAERNIHNLEREIIITGTCDLGPQWKARRKQSALFTRRLLRRYKLESWRRGVQAIWERVRGASRAGSS